jgi:phosphate transport system ATP-binding protein
MNPTPTCSSCACGGLTLSDVSVRYRNFTAVHGIHLTIPDCGITALVGPSGCGKSSLLHAMNRLTDLIPGCRVEGSILDGAGTELTDPGLDVLALRRRIGMVFQKPNPFPHSIRRNFEIPLREHGLPRSKVDEVMEKNLREVGLWDEVSSRLDESALKLSGGQQQRLCIARALALDPEVILFDEPCSALDPIASAVVEEHIAALRGRVTVVIVTHNLAQARRIADRVGVFWIRDGAGTIVEEGEVEAVFGGAGDAEARRYLEGISG